MENIVIEPQMLQFAKLLVVEVGAADLRRFHIEKIARIAIAQDKISDNNWIKENINRFREKEIKNRVKRIVGKSLDSEGVRLLVTELSKHREEDLRNIYHDSRFFQFVLVEEILAFKDMFGGKSFHFLQKTLQDPTHIHPFWAAQFMLSVRKLGEKIVKKQKSPYHYVVESEIFADSLPAREEYRLAVAKRLIEKYHMNLNRS